MLSTIITISGWAFWVIIALIIVVDVAFLTVDDDDGIGWAAAFTTLAFVAAVLFTDAFSGVRIAALIIGVIAYYLLGVGWSFKKWYDFLIAKRDLAMKDWPPGTSSVNNANFAEYMTKRIPKASDHKARIVTWMTLWPFSFVWWVLTWPRRAFNWLYARLSTAFDRMAARVFAS